MINKLLKIKTKLEYRKINKLKTLNLIQKN